MTSLSLSNSLLRKAVSLACPRAVEKDHSESLYMELFLEIIDFHMGAISPVQKDQVLDVLQSLCCLFSSL